MTLGPAISVIVPAYRPRDFSGLRASIAANSDVAAEWIVVDDGSGKAYAEHFGALPKPVRLIRLAQNVRQGGARNAGLAAARGAWIKFLDADDQLDQGHLAQLLAATPVKDSRALPFAPTRHVFASGRSMTNDSWRDLPADPEAQHLRLLVRPFLHHCGALFPRDLLQALGGYDASLITDEDGDLLLRMLEAGWHFRPVPDVFYLYRHDQPGARVSSDDNPAKLAARVRVCDTVMARAMQDGRMTPALALALAQRMDRIAMAHVTTQPVAARQLLDRAARVSPGYRPDMHPLLRLLRQMFGPRAVPMARAGINRLRGRPPGGAQG